MKWLTRRTWAHRKQAKECWHYWFAWHPVTVKVYPDGAEERIWLTMILRKGTYVSSFFESCWNYKYKTQTK